MREQRPELLYRMVINKVQDYKENLDLFASSEPVFLENSSNVAELSLLFQVKESTSKNEFTSFCYTIIETISDLAHRWDSRLKSANGSYYGDFLKYYGIYFFAISAETAAFAESLPSEDFTLTFYPKDAVVPF